jgi:ABC-type molybdate transport system permease subunit
MSMILLLGLPPLVLGLVLVIVVQHRTLGEKVYGLAALEAHP